MKEKLQHFMMGRYGIDSFSKFLLGVTVFFCAIDLFFHSVVLNSWTLLLLIYTFTVCSQRTIANGIRKI